MQSLIPALPPKINEFGSEVMAHDLQHQLEVFINQILQIKPFEKLVCLQSFLSEGSIAETKTPRDTMSVENSKKSLFANSKLTLSNNLMQFSPKNSI